MNNNSMVNKINNMVIPGEIMSKILELSDAPTAYKLFQSKAINMSELTKHMVLLMDEVLSNHVDSYDMDDMTSQQLYRLPFHKTDNNSMKMEIYELKETMEAIIRDGIEDRDIKISTDKGYCYLMPLDNIINGLRRRNVRISETRDIEIINRWVNQRIFLSRCLHQCPTVIRYVSLLNLLSVNIDSYEYVYYLFHSYDDVYHLTYSQGYQDTSFYGFYDELSTICSNDKIGKEIQLLDIIEMGQKEGSNDEIPDVMTYNSTDIVQPKINIQTLQVGPRCGLLSNRELSKLKSLDTHVHLKISVVGYETKEFCEYSDHLRQIRHNLVCGNLKGGTDMKLTTIISDLEGVERDMTPDFIDPINIIVAEVGTTMKTTKEGLEDEALDKINKYKYILDRLPTYSLYVLIVGRNKITSNLILRDDIVFKLCSRFKTGRELEALISDTLGRDIFHEFSSHDQLMSESCLNQSFRVLDSPGFPQSMNEIITPLNVNDKEHISHMLSESYDRTGEIPEYPSVMSYIEKFKHHECRHDKKRITIFPLLQHNKNFDQEQVMSYPLLDPSTSNDMPSELKSIWEKALYAKKENVSLNIQVMESLGLKEYERHEIKKKTRFTPILSQDEKIDLAASGIGRKQLRREKKLVLKYAETKKSFHPSVDTQDIQDFIKSKRWHDDSSQSIHKNIIKLIKDDKLSNGKVSDQISSLDAFDFITSREIIFLSSFISEIVMELSYTYKHYSSGLQMYHKVSPSGVHLIIKPTKTHVFFSLGIPKDRYISADPGRVGPMLFSSKNYLYTDWSSINESGIDHFVKTGPYMSSIYMFLSECSQDVPGALSDHYKETFNSIFLLHVNNKLDSEELVGSQRFLWMRSMEEIKPNPDFFISRLPDILRSRLTAFLLHKTLWMMDSLRIEPIVKAPRIIDENTTTIDFLNIKSIFTGKQITLNEKINEFYYGYVITKARGADSSFKIVKKILKEEYAAKDLKAKAITLLSKPSLFESDEVYMRFIAQRMRKKLIDQLGENFESVIHQDIIRKAASTSFEEISTLKASARDHSQDLIIDDELIGQETWVVNAAIRKMNKKEAEKRPKVIVALKELIEIFKLEFKRSPYHLVELAPWCLNRLLDKGYIDSDIFSKPQHMGVREIHVLEVSARIVQYYGEMIAFELCSYFKSETTCNPDTKKHFVRTHYKEVQQLNMRSPVTFCKSADATKWCQRHHILTFAYIAAYTVPPAFHNFLLSTFSLWPHKRLNFPVELASNFIANKDVKSNEFYERLRKEFFTGTGSVCGIKNNKILIEWGMWQGIWHRWSSFKQGSNMEIHLDICKEILKSLNINHHMSIIYGSDDSGALLTIEGGYTKKTVTLAHRLLFWKEKLSEYASINNSDAKTTISALEVFEYNSEWFVAGMPIKPTFRWISAALTMSTTHRFIDRFRTQYNALKDCIEGGCSTLTASVIQICQSWLHYLMMGFQSSDLSDIICKLLLKVKDPSLGYFIHDSDYCSGIPGYDYNLYWHSIQTDYSKYLPELDEEDPQNMYTYSGQKIKTVARDLRGVKLRHGHLSTWESVRDKFDVTSAEKAIKQFDNDPLLLFGRHVSWEDSYPHLIVKIFAPGVKESLSTFSSLARTATSSMYLFSRPCLSTNFSKDKLSLLAVLLKRLEQGRRRTLKDFNHDLDSSISKIECTKRFFPYWKQYNQIKKDLDSLKTSIIEDAIMKPKGKVTLTIIEAEIHSISIMELCKRKWWGIGKVALSNKQIPKFWAMMKEDFPFLQDTAEETNKVLGTCMLELKNLLEGLTLKGRRITLFDTSTRTGSTAYSLSRIFWPKSKLQFSRSESSINTLRSELSSICTFPLNKSEKIRMCSEKIKYNDELHQPFSSISDNNKVLKIMHDLLNGENKLQIMARLNSIHKGVFGIFVQRQIYNHNSEKRNKYEGEGIWIGKISSTDCRIQLLDDHCINIELRNSNNLREVGFGLSEIMRSFKVEATDIGLIKTKFKLSKSGNIRLRHSDTTCYPVTINPNISIDILSGIHQQVWNLDVTNRSVKITATARDQDESYTVLSHQIKNSDWDPTDGTFSSTYMSCWHRAVPLPIEEYERVLCDVPLNNTFRGFWQGLKKGEVHCEWDILNFSDLLRSHLLNERLNKIEPDDYDDSVDEDLVMMTLKAISSREIDASEFDWAKEMIDEEASGIEYISPINDELIEQTGEYLKSFMIDGINHLYMDRQIEMTFPRRKFFDRILSLSEIVSGLNISNIIKEIKSIYRSPICRKIFMIMAKKHDGLDGPIDEDDAYYSLDQTISTMESEPIEVLKEKIEDVKYSLEHSRGHIKAKLQTTLFKLETRLRESQGIERYHALDVDGHEFFKNYVTLLKSLHISDYSRRTSAIDLQASLLKIDLAIIIQDEVKLNNLSPQEAQMEFESLNRNMLTEKILLILNKKFNMSFEVYGYKFGDSLQDYTIEKDGKIMITPSFSF